MPGIDATLWHDWYQREMKVINWCHSWCDDDVYKKSMPKGVSVPSPAEANVAFCMMRNACMHQIPPYPATPKIVALQQAQGLHTMLSSEHDISQHLNTTIQPPLSVFSVWHHRR